jgi:hypothetical protein
MRYICCFFHAVFLYTEVGDINMRSGKNIMPLFLTKWLHGWFIYLLQL